MFISMVDSIKGPRPTDNHITTLVTLWVKPRPQLLSSLFPIQVYESLILENIVEYENERSYQSGYSRNMILHCLDHTARLCLYFFHNISADLVFSALQHLRNSKTWPSGRLHWHSIHRADDYKFYHCSRFPSFWRKPFRKNISILQTWINLTLLSQHSCPEVTEYRFPLQHKWLLG